MADGSQTKGPNVTTRSVVADFIGSVWGKVLTVLAAITMVLGIAAEGVSLYKNWSEAQSARADADAATFKPNIQPFIVRQEDGGSEPNYGPPGQGRETGAATSLTKEQKAFCDGLKQLKLPPADFCP
jgi:hypothetical protein